MTREWNFGPQSPQDEAPSGLMRLDVSDPESVEECIENVVKMIEADAPRMLTNQDKEQIRAHMREQIDLLIKLEESGEMKTGDVHASELNLGRNS